MRSKTKGKEASDARKLFAYHMKRLRGITNITHKVIAEKTGLTAGYLSDVENSKSNISMDNADAIAKVLNVPLYVMLIPE